MNSREYKVCKNCVMDTSDIDITFDSEGVCDHCNTFKKSIKEVFNNGKTSSKLESLSEKIKKKTIGKDYDCIIGMSGGIDSSYLVYAAKNLMGLNPLVFHVDAGWNSQIAVNNIEKLVDGLNLDLFTEVINWEEMKDLQLSFFKSGVPHIDTPQDHAFFATMYKFAVKNNIKYILTGANYSTECIRNPKEWMYYQSDSIQIRNIHKIYGSKPLRTFPLTSVVWHKIWLPYFRGIKIETPLNYLDYTKENAKKILMQKFGWQPYPQKHFESRFTKFYESYWLYERFGYDVRKVQFSSLILTNQMTREEAIELLKNKPYNEETISQESSFIANKLGISTKELDQFFLLPKKSYKDYKNQEYIYDLGSKIMQILKLQRGGKR